MNGAEFLCESLLHNDIDVCFANPGTSEMHFVAALDKQPRMRCVLGLFEGVVTGAADGYTRMADKPAATLLHLGSGLGNGLANLHNAKRARSPMVNIVGDHAQHHLQYDAPLTSDIKAIASAVSDSVITASLGPSFAGDITRCIEVAVAPPGNISTLILPADVAWTEMDASSVVKRAARPGHTKVDSNAVAEAAKALRSGKATLLLGGRALRAQPLALASTIARHTGAKLLAETSNARIERGHGVAAIEKLPYPVDAALAKLQDTEHLILVGTRSPVAFFAYPGRPSRLIPDECRVSVLTLPEQDHNAALEQLMGELNLDNITVAPEPQVRPEVPAASSDALTAGLLCRTIAALLPENAIVTDESITQGRSFYGHSHASARHDYLQLTGGAIGIGLPLATGAAVACPQRKVVALQADGSGMYTVQALWTQARENLDCLTIVFANRRYAILEHEMKNVGVAQMGDNARSMLQIDRPDISWVNLSEGLGVPAVRASNLREFIEAFERGLKHRGPFVIEAELPG